MPKSLRLKRTPAEQAAHEIRKAHRAARRASASTSKTTRSPSSDHEREYEDAFARAEEARFREKLADAAADDDGFGDGAGFGVGARGYMDTFGARVPRRWAEDEREGEGVGVDPWMMEDEEYAEWVRAGMWRKKNAAAIERQRKEAAAREAAEAEARRAMRAKEEKRARRRRERAERRADEARDAYDTRWRSLLSSSSEEGRALRFGDVPWPVAEGESISAEAVGAFLLGGGTGGEGGDREKERKEVVRRTLLRFHPDKFEGRLMGRVVEQDRDKVRDAVGAVVRAVGGLGGLGGE